VPLYDDVLTTVNGFSVTGSVNQLMVLELPTQLANHTRRNLSPQNVSNVLGDKRPFS
jgi:hypothetical protein